MRTPAVLAVIAACGAPTVDLPTPIEHASYPIRARVPVGWTAEASHAAIYPADVWLLHPRDRSDTGIQIILGWLPRGGRQSAYFPGGTVPDAHPVSRRIGGISRDGTGENADRHFRIDFDVGELAVSIHAFATTDEQARVIDAILDAVTIDSDPRPATLSPARRAFELAREWAKRNGFPTDHIVYVGPLANDSRYGFTVFHDRGLVPLGVDLASATVTRMPL